jgi:hypothetical protein
MIGRQRSAQSCDRVSWEIQANILQKYDTTYAPYQTIITEYWGAAEITYWAQGMCSIWNTAVLQPTRLGVWVFYDRDVSPIEEYWGLHQ